MNIRRLLPADADWVHDLIQPAYRGELSLEQVVAMITDPDTVAIGDPGLPVYLRLVRYRVPLEFAVPDLGHGDMVQLADLHPLDPRGQIDAQVSAMRPIIAEGLRLMRARGHGNLRVWAELPEVLAGAFERNLFPGAARRGRFIHMPTLNAAWAKAKA